MNEKEIKEKLNKLAQYYYRKKFEDCCHLQKARIQRVLRARGEI